MNHEAIKEFFVKNALSITVQVLGLLILGLNAYVAFKLVPITERFIKLEHRVLATEFALDEINPFIARFYVTEERVNAVKSQLNRVEDKIDRIGL